MLESKGKNLKINKVLQHEYNVEEKPLSSFPDHLIKHLIKTYSLTGKVLDVMCGRGEHAQAFSNNNLDAYCLDISEHAAFVYEKKKERLAVCDSGKDIYPYEDNTFDVTFCKSGIEHVNPDHLISEMYRVTKPGGKIIILTLDWWYTYRMHYIDHTHGYGVPWMKHSLKLILQTYGFDNVSVENIYYLAFTWKFPPLRIFCWIIRNLFPYPYIDNFRNPIWKIVRFSNELQVIGVGEKK
jgi:SAM-dependent methyltransferase